MPAGQSDMPFMKGLENNPDWRLVYFDDEQRLYVNIKTLQGKKIYEGITDGQTIYPDEFSKNLIIAHNAFLFVEGETAKQQGLDATIKAFGANHLRVSMQIILLFAAKYEQLQPHINDFCKNYVNDFAKNKNLYAQQDGYINRLLAILSVNNHLENNAKIQNRQEEARLYAAKSREYKTEQEKIMKNKRW